MNLIQQRAKALELLTDSASANEYHPIDYYLDANCRKLLNLPERPISALPYAGWMIGSTTPKVTKNKISSNGIEFIKQWEGCRTNAYKCPAGIWTIGYGHTKTASSGLMISHTEADRLLYADIKEFEATVRQLVEVPLNQYQFDALVSFVFNIGIRAFRDSTLLRLLDTLPFKVSDVQVNARLTFLAYFMTDNMPLSLLAENLLDLCHFWVKKVLLRL